MLRAAPRPIAAKPSIRRPSVAPTVPSRSMHFFNVKNVPALKTKIVAPIQTPKTQVHARLFATDRQILRQFKKSEIKRVSIQEPRADEMIRAIKKGDYGLAKVLKSQGVNVDGHNSGENTPLADAAKRRDTKAVLFLLKDLKANPNASCDCPCHRTALMYAVMNSDIATIRALLDNGASIDALDSNGRNAIDIAKDQKVKQLLIDHRENERMKALEAGVPIRKSLPK